MSSAAPTDICGIDVQALYLNDPGNKQEPVGYVLCSEMGNTCMKNGCSCRSAANAEVGGTTKYFGVCIQLQKGKDCVTSGDDYLTCAVSTESSGSTEAQNESNVSRSSTNTQATTESNATPIATASASASGSTADAVKVATHTASSDSMSTTVMIVIIVVAVVFVALVSWVIRAYCMRRSAAQNKLASRRNRSDRGTNFDATSPTNMTGRSSATPSFPAFDRRTRAMQSPSNGGRGGRSGRNTPRGREPNSGRGIREPTSARGGRDPTSARGGREPTSARGGREPASARGRRNQDIDAQFAPGGPRDITREPASGRGRRNPSQKSDAPFPPLGGPRREPTSGRGRRSPDLDAPFPPLGGLRREPTSGRGRNAPDIDSQFAPNGPRGFREAGPQREPTSGRGRRDNGYQAEAVTRTPPRAMQHASPKKPTRPPTNNGPEPSGGTVYTGRNTYDRVAAFAQLAAFEAPPPPPPRPQKAIKPVPVSDPIPKIARAPPPARPPAPKRPVFQIPEDPLPADYDILSPKTARSLAPSVASSATTVVAPGRNRPTPLQQNRRPQYSNAPPSYYQSGYSRDDNKYAESKGLDDSRFDESKYEESDYGDSRYDESNYGDSRYDESGFDNKFKAKNRYDESFVSEVSSMAWSGASGLSDDSYYHAADSNTARIPVIDAPNDDDDAHSEDGYSDWGHSTQHSADAFRSTAASDASFFSVNSDFTDSKSVFKEREF
ncbi:hypothetical protein P3T76_015317 [Phytophthora citrophthora]|uniref:Uncharacterized protein n=1 Tax=Phytophthora citrophthora TaxID=4793 RepID=A0AAD9FZI0_9STRA|nr:hypothetical protein P3T76_015317 [Phytophthora citrophthora]